MQQNKPTPPLFTCKHKMQNPQQRNICRREEKGFSTQVPPYYIKCSIWRGEARNDEFGGDFFFFFLIWKTVTLYVFARATMCMEQSILAGWVVGQPRSGDIPSVPRWHPNGALSLAEQGHR